MLTINIPRPHSPGNFGQPQQHQQRQPQQPQQQASSDLDFLGSLNLGGQSSAPASSAPAATAPSDPFGGNLFSSGPSSQPFSTTASKPPGGGLNDLLGDFGGSSMPLAPAPKGPPPDLSTLNVALSDIQPGPNPPAQVYDKNGLKVRVAACDWGRKRGGGTHECQVSCTSLYRPAFL